MAANNYSPYQPARDSSSGGFAASADYHGGAGDFASAATASGQRPTSGDDRQPPQTPPRFTYPTPQPGGALGF